MISNQHGPALLSITLAGALALTACSPDSSESDDIVTSTSSPASTTAAAPAPTHAKESNEMSTYADSCPGLSGQDAYNKWIGEVPPYDFGSGTGATHEWDRVSEQENYSSEAPLSWIVVGFYDATTSSPYHIMLFHQGCYIGTATSEAYGFYPDVTRTGDNSIAVTFHFAYPDETIAEHTGTTTATFTWNDTTQSVEMAGNVPQVSDSAIESDKLEPDNSTVGTEAGVCDLDRIIAEDGSGLDASEMITVYCDGEYAIYGAPGTDFMKYSQHDGSSWRLMPTDGEKTGPGKNGPCYDVGRAAANGVPQEVIEKMLACR